MEILCLTPDFEDVILNSVPSKWGNEYLTNQYNESIT